MSRQQDPIGQDDRDHLVLLTSTTEGYLAESTCKFRLAWHLEGRAKQIWKTNVDVRTLLMPNLVVQ